jgi:hypothetical protein
LGLHGQRPRDRHPLLLAARQLRGIGLGFVRQSHLLEKVASAGERHRLLDTLDLHRRLDDVPQRRPVRKQVEMLKDHANVAALPGRFPRRHLEEFAASFAVADQVAVHVEPAGVDLLEVVDAAQERRLART